MKLEFTKSWLNNRTLKLFSILLAFVAWLVAANTISEDGRYTISEVPVEISSISSAAMTKLGLEPMEVGAITATVKVEGKRYIIGGLTPQDIKILPDLSQVKEAQTYNIPLKGSDANAKGFEVVEVKPPFIEVRFDRFASKKLEIEPEILGVATTEGYLIEKEIISPQEVVITGPEADIAKVSRCVVTTEVSGILNDTYAAKEKLKLLDKDGNVVDSKYISLDVEEAQITIPILKTKQVPLSIDFINVPENFSTDLLNFTVSNETVLVAGPAKAVDALDKIVLGYIDVKNLGLDSSFVYNITLPAGFVNVKNIQTVKVDFDASELVSRVYNLQDIRAVNVPLDYDVTIQTSELSGVEIIGYVEVMDALAAGDLIVEVDMSEREINEGQFTTGVKIYSPAGLPVWAKGTYEAIILVTKTVVVEEEEIVVKN